MLNFSSKRLTLNDYAFLFFSYSKGMDGMFEQDKTLTFFGELYEDILR